MATGNSRRLIHRAAMIVALAALCAGRPERGAAQSADIDALFRQFNEQFDAGSYREAERTAQAMVDNSTTPGWQAAALNCLSRCYHSQSRYADAEAALRRALPIPLNSGNSNRGWIPSNLGRACAAQKKYADAAQFYNQAMQEFESLYGPESKEVATILRNLGWLYHDQQKYDVSEKYHLRAYAIRQSTLGEESSATVDSLSALGDISRHLKRSAEAKDRLTRAIAIEERVLGANHPDHAVTLGYLASLYRDQSQYAEAEPLDRQVLKIREITHGPKSSNITSTLKELALDLEKQGKNDEAKTLRVRAASIEQGPATAANAAENPFQVGQRVRVKVSSTNVMHGPEVIGSVEKGAENEIKQTNGGWCLLDVTLNGRSVAGWIHSRDLTSAAAGTRPLPALKPFTSDEGRFSVSMPGTPRFAKQVANGMDNYSFLLESTRGTYMVSYFDLTAGLSLPADRGMQAFAAARKGEITKTTTDVSLPNGATGKEAMIQLSGGETTVRLRLYIVGSRYYVVSLDGSRDHVTSRDADAFFDSFKTN